MAVPYTFGSATTSIPLSQLDSNFATTITLGNTAIQLGNTVTTLNNMTLANVTVSSGNVTATNVTATNVTSPLSTALTLQSNAGNTAVTIDTSQNVGVGTTTPVSNANQKSVTINGTSYSRVDFQVSGSTTAYLYSGASNTSLGTQGATFLGLETNATERMRIDSSGNVGIGTSSPSTKLQVAIGNVSTFGQVSNAGLAISGAGSNGNYAQIGLGYAGTYQPASIGYTTTTQTGYTYGDIVFGTRSVNTDTAPTERMRIVSDGTARFSMGNFTTSPSSTNAGIELANNGTSPFINHSQTATSLQTYYAFINGNGTVGTIKCTGSSTQFNTSSDVRLKKNIVDAPSAIASIQQIGIKSFDWKADDLHQEYGVIAQELDLIAPEAISHGATEDEMWGVDYSKLVPRMLKAIQEQQALIQTLQTQVAQLQAKVGV